MAKIGGAALTIIGGIFFGPVGALVGGILGQILFPAPGVKGPRIDELNVQTSTVGAPVQLRYGTCKGAGNIIWSGGLIETKHEDEQGGFLGIGGQKVTNYTYSASFAIGICDGEDGSPAQPAGIRRMWAGPDLIYDASDDASLTERLNLTEILTNIVEVIAGIRAMSAQLSFTFYDGSDDQLPDPTIESYETAGTVPAFRGLAYVVFDDFQLAKYSNQIPPIIIETYSGAPTECGLFTSGNLYPWLEGSRDPREPLNSHIYSGGGAFTPVIGTALAQLGGDYMLAVPIQGDSNPPTVHSWLAGGATNKYCAGDDTEDRVEIQLSVNHFPWAGRHECEIAFFDDIPNSFVAAFGINNFVWWGGGGVPGALRGFWVAVPDGESPGGFFGSFTPTGGFNAELFDNADVYYLIDDEIEVQRTILPPDPCEFGTPLAGAPGYCVFNGQIAQGITWTQVSGTFKVLQKYRVSTISFDPTVVWDYPVDPCLRDDDPNYNNQAFWEAAHAAALASGDYTGSIGLSPSDVYGVDYPHTQDFAFFSECDTVDATCVPMALIVSDLCRRAGLRTDTGTQIDVSGLTTCVPGYPIGRAMSARDAMGPLRLFGLWDAVEGELLRFVERGSAIVATISEDDLGAHENGSEAPPSVEVTRVQEKELPRRLRLHFPNYLHDHEPSEQAASRLSTEAVEEIDLEIAVSMDPDVGAQLAEIHLYDTWVSRNRFTFVLNNDWLHLEPTDCLEIPVEGETRRVRLVSATYKIGGLIECEAVADDDGSYQSTAVATPEGPSGGPIVGPGAGPICGSVAVLLDIPRLREADIDAGYYVAIYGLCPETWTCGELYRSSDGGLTYGRVARTNDQTVVGQIVSITGPSTDPVLPGESPQYDTTNAITVNLFQGALASITDAQIAAGQNLAAIGIHGRWVIIQFKTATFDTGDQWTLTDLIWGVNETQHLLYTTFAGDTFVLLSDPALIRVPEEAAAIGVSKSFKAVTCGEPIDSVTPFSFTTQGLSYRRTCPSTVISATTSTPPGSPSDGDAYLLPNATSLDGEWADHGGEIAHWSDETDSWVFCTPASGTVIIIEDDPGGPVIAPGGGGTPTPAPWTPAIPPLPDIDSSGDIDASYFVAHTGTGYVKVLGADLAGGSSGFPNATYLTEDDETADLPNSLRLIAGSNVIFDTDTGGNTLEIHATGGVGGSGVDAYQVSDVQSTTNASLTTTDLSVGLTVGVWFVEATIISTSHATPDFQHRYDFSGTATAALIATINAGSGTPVQQEPVINTTGLAFNTTSLNATVVHGTLNVSVGGTFRYQFSQVTNTPGTPITVRAGSYLRCTPAA